MTAKHIIYKVLLLPVLILSIIGCSSSWEDDMAPNGARGRNPGDRVESENDRKVLLLYAAGHNNLGYTQGFIPKNIKDLTESWLPGNKPGDDVLLVYSHIADRSLKPTQSHLIRLYSRYDGTPAADTLVTYPGNAISASPGQLNEVLSYIQETFSARSYGMIFSSHGTGYLPVGYYKSPSSYTFPDKAAMSQKGGMKPTAAPYIEEEYDPSLPMVKSVGDDTEGTLTYELDIRDFARALPMKMDYIIFDACLMGGIEVAYELREKCGRLAVSQAEILAEGFFYKSLAKHLLQNEEPDLEAVCKDYFVQYDIQSGAYRSATISMIDCGRLEPLARFCKSFFASHRDGLAVINPNKVQRFYRSGKHWFYDLESIVTEAGASPEELEDLHSALDECVLYKAHTPKILEQFDITTYSGFSMYLPCHGGTELDKYYRTLKWNEATELVEY